MTLEDHTGREHQRQAIRQQSRLFTVRLWAEEVTGARAYRGTVQEVRSGAFRSFRNWSDLTSFMIAWMEDDQCSEAGSMEGEMS
ncbi:MAG: hypothetical protein KatS3mg059_0709 [Thermomicrobiales bacterium]|nr:MAG: hypothetical protein KatS3mg059_0709 [Thermomicrobiales bacterium]